MRKVRFCRTEGCGPEASLGWRGRGWVVRLLDRGLPLKEQWERQRRE